MEGNNLRQPLTRNTYITNPRKYGLYNQGVAFLGMRYTTLFSIGETPIVWFGAPGVTVLGKAAVSEVIDQLLFCTH